MRQIRQIPGFRCRKWCTCYLLAFLCLALRTLVPCLAQRLAIAGCFQNMNLRCLADRKGIGHLPGRQLSPGAVGVHLDYVIHGVVVEHPLLARWVAGGCLSTVKDEKGFPGCEGVADLKRYLPCSGLADIQLYDSVIAGDIPAGIKEEPRRPVVCVAF